MKRDESVRRDKEKMEMIAWLSVLNNRRKNVLLTKISMRLFKSIAHKITYISNISLQMCIAHSHADSHTHSTRPGVLKQHWNICRIQMAGVGNTLKMLWRGTRDFMEHLITILVNRVETHTLGFSSIEQNLKVDACLFCQLSNKNLPVK